ncbi:unnamed protein product [Urochloa humidicola]
MRVRTSAAGFRALVQELTGRDADPSKYSPDDLDGAGASAAAAADLDCGAAHGLSPGGAAASCDTVVASHSPAAADHHPDDASAVAAPYGGDYDEEEDEDGFKSQLLENNYAVFSPTLLYDQHPHSKVCQEQLDWSGRCQPLFCNLQVILDVFYHHRRSTGSRAANAVLHCVGVLMSSGWGDTDNLV